MGRGVLGGSGGDAAESSLPASLERRWEGRALPLSRTREWEEH